MRPVPGAERRAQPDRKRAPLPATCAAVQAQILDYLDGELPAAPMQQVQAHLDRCAACRQEADLFRDSERALTSALSAVPPAGDLRADFYARLATSQARRTRRQRWLSWSLAVPALAVGLLAVLLLRPHPSPAPPRIAVVPSKPPSLLVRAPEPGAPDRETPAPEKKRQGSRAVKRNPVEAGSKATRVASSGMHRRRHWPAPHPAPIMLASKPERPPRPKTGYRPIWKVVRADEPKRPFAPDGDIRLNVEPPEASSSPETFALRGGVERASPSVLSEQLGTATQQLANLKDAHRNAVIADEVSLRVVDEERGFVASTHVSSLNSEHGKQVIAVEADSTPLAVPASKPLGAASEGQNTK
ncbi:MAG TPA: anti-sigma factor [Chthonomonadaceae bacterium]|nr:anti-sigma factor [Chthonomonadaceae bacterium]